jgi:Leucine-rich repeat (LRR) protein
MVNPLTIQDIPDHVLYYEIFNKLVCEETESLRSEDDISNKSIIQVDKRFNSLMVDYMGNKIRNDKELVEWNKLWDVGKWTDNQKINNYYKFDKCDDISKRIINAFEQNLTTLYLYNNQITVIDPSIGNLINLTRLYLSHNQITVIDPSIGNLIKLTRLYLFSNQITVIDPSIGNLINLTELYLHNNQITVIDPSIGNLINLTTLSLSSNQITVIDPSIGNLINLTKLYLSSNQITVIDPSIGNLINLTKLVLSKNQITVIDPVYGTLKDNGIYVVL